MTDQMIPFVDSDPLDDNEIIQSQLGVQIPRLKIAYQGSKDRPPTARPGDLYISTTGQIFDVVEVVMLALVPTYNYLEGKFAENRIVSCWSANCMVPDGTGINPQEGPCNIRNDAGHIVPSCEHRKWDRTDPDRPTPPACGDHFNMALWDLKGERGLLFESKNKGNAAFRFLLQQIKARGKDLSPDGKIPPRFRCRFLLTAESSGQYYVPRVEILWDRPVTDEELSKCSPFMGGLKEEMTRLVRPYLPSEGAEQDTPF